MGTYTTHYNLFLPSVGEQGWGELVNGNFTTIDATMKGLDTRLTTCESTDVAYNTRLETLEAGNFETVNVAGTINAGEIKANLSPSINLTSVSGEISAIKLSTEASLVHAKSGSGSNVNIGGGTYTYTYKENPICNDVIFNASAYGSSDYASKISYVTLTINGQPVIDITANAYNGSTITDSYSTTLKEGDVLVAYAKAGSANGTNAYVTLTCSGYLTN